MGFYSGGRGHYDRSHPFYIETCRNSHNSHRCRYRVLDDNDDGIALALDSIIASGASSAAITRNLHVYGTYSFLEMVLNMRDTDSLVIKDDVRCCGGCFLTTLPHITGPRNTPASPLCAVSTH